MSPVVNIARRRSKTAVGSIVELAVIIAIAVGLAFAIQAWLVKPYKIPSGSMEPTLAVGQRVLVDRIGMDFGNPSVGDIVVFHPPAKAKQQEDACGNAAQGHAGGAACSRPEAVESSENFIKRVVAGPGDEIMIKEGHVYRRAAGTKSFVREKDSYIRLGPCAGTTQCDFPVPIKVPAGHWFMMGDNRGYSDDSRFWGPVPTSWIIGVAFATYWPPDRIGIF